MSLQGEIIIKSRNVGDYIGRTNTNQEPYTALSIERPIPEGLIPPYYFININFYSVLF
jgi:hypothetical protein